MRYLDLALLIGVVIFGLLGFFESLSVGNLTFAALSLASLLFARLYLNLFSPPPSGREEPMDEEEAAPHARRESGEE